MSQLPRPPANSAPPGLSVVEAPPSPEASSPSPSVESTADYTERVGHQFLLVEALKERGPGHREAALEAEQRLGEMMRELRQRAPRGPPSLAEQTPPPALGPHADIIGKLPRAPGPPGPSRLLDRAHRLVHPLQVELLRAQQAFNTGLVEVLQEAPQRVARSPDDDVAAWIRQTLEPLADPEVWTPRTHRRGVSARAVGLVKHSALLHPRRQLRPAFARMRQWNQRAIDLLCALHPGPLPRRAEAERLLARLAQVADPLPPHARLPDFLHAALLPQREFTHHVHHALEHQLALVPAVGDEEYRQWCQAREPARIAEATRQARALARPSTFTVVVGASVVPAAHWRECVASVWAQTHDAWELCVAGPRALLEEMRGQLPPEQARDSRLRWLPLADRTGMADALDTALASARGDAVAFLDAADRLAPHALVELALALHAHPTSPLLYTDEDRLDAGGQRRRPFFKPDWSRDLHRESHYASRLLVARRELCEALGGMGRESEGAELLDFVLRASERQVPITHLSAVLYHRRERPRAFQVVSPHAHAALTRHLSRCGEYADVWTTSGDQLRVRHRVRGTPRVSLIVPVTDPPERLARLWNGLRDRPAWDDWQLLLVSSHPVEPRTRQFLDTLEDPRVVKLTGTPRSHRAALDNFAARHAKGELLLFLDDGLEVVDEEWLRELVSQAQRPEVGLVAPLLLAPDGRVRHAGVVLGPGGLAAHPFRGSRPDAPWTPFGRSDHTRDYLAVTRACVMVRRDVFEAVGGHDERFHGSGGDGELGPRVIQRGLRCVYTPHTRLIHHAPVARPLETLPDRDAWLSYAAFRPWARSGDPFHNPQLTLGARSSGLRTDERPGETLAVQRLAWESTTP